MTERLLTPGEAAVMLSVTATTLARWRALGAGPRYAEMGSSEQPVVRYDPTDLRKFVALNMRERTAKLEGALRRVRGLEREVARLTSLLDEERRKRAGSGERTGRPASPAPRGSAAAVEEARRLLVREAYKWMVTGESGRQLIERLEGLELPGSLEKAGASK